MGLKLSPSLRLIKEEKTLAAKERHRANELACIVLSFPTLKLRFLNAFPSCINAGKNVITVSDKDVD